MNDPHLHNLETGLHEMLLQSEHRTLDPSEADYFYVPVSTFLCTHAVPLMWSPNKYGSSPLLCALTCERHILAFFKGRVMEDKPAYSCGTRQFLAKMTRDNNWWGKHRIHVGDAMPKGNISESVSYSEALASSVFCFSLMGEGWGSRFDEAVLHGCIPVLIHDEVEPSWNFLLAVETYSVRIAHDDMERVPEILSEEEIARMQANVARVWRRHIWTGYRPYNKMVEQLLTERRNGTAPVLSRPQQPADYDPAQDDALDTSIQWLYARLNDLGAHARGA